MHFTHALVTCTNDDDDGTCVILVRRPPESRVLQHTVIASERVAVVVPRDVTRVLVWRWRLLSRTVPVAAPWIIPWPRRSYAHVAGLATTAAAAIWWFLTRVHSLYAVNDDTNVHVSDIIVHACYSYSNTDVNTFCCEYSCNFLVCA